MKGPLRRCRPHAGRCWLIHALLLSFVPTALVSCSPGSRGAADAGVAVAPLDAGPPAPPPPVTFSLAAQLPDAGVQLVPTGDSEPPLVEPTQALELRTDLGLRNFRVRLFDEADRALVSDDVAEVSESGLVYRMSFPEPLRPGHAYVLAVEPQTGPLMEDALGRPVPEQRFELRVAGEKEKPAPARPGRKRGR